MISCLKILIASMVISGSLVWGADVQERKGYFGKKIDKLQTIIQEEKHSLERHEQKIQNTLKVLCGGLVVCPYTILYYGSVLPPELLGYIYYALPPWTIAMYLLTGQKSMQRSSLLTQEIEQELKTFLRVLPQIEAITDRVHRVTSENEKEFLSHLEVLSTSNKELNDFFVDLQLRVIDTYRGNQKITQAYSRESLGKLIAIYTIMKILEEQFNHDYSRIVTRKPSLHVGIFETWDFKFHSYTIFIDFLANEFRNNTEEILQPQLEALSVNEDLSKNLQKILQIIVKHYKFDNAPALDS